MLYKDDAIAIAKHFYDLMTNKEKVDFFHVMNDEPQVSVEILKASKINRICARCGTHLAYDAPEDSCLCGNANNIQSFARSTTPIHQSETAYLNSTKANKERLEESIKQLERGETTYKSLNLDSVGEIKNNEIFNKEGDSHA